NLKPSADLLGVRTVCGPLAFRAPSPRSEDDVAITAALLQRGRLDARPLTNYIIRRVAGAIPLLLFISIVTYAMMALAPGGPTAILGPRGAANPAVVARINALYGLDKPWYV